MNAVEGNFEEGTNPGYSDVTRKRCGDNRIRKKKRFMTHVRGVWFGTFSVLGAGKKNAGVERFYIGALHAGAGNSAVH